MRGLRKRLRFSQKRFADTFGLSINAVRHWESGRREPEAAARELLLVIAHDSPVVMRALAQSQPSKAKSGIGVGRAGTSAVQNQSRDKARLSTTSGNPWCSIHFSKTRIAPEYALLQN
jgi:transcriptional regulator with XRE-family HTH domain